MTKREEQIEEIIGRYTHDYIETSAGSRPIIADGLVEELTNLLTKEHNDGYLLGLKEGTELNVTQSSQSETLSPQSETLSKECITSDTNEIKREAVRGFAEHLSKNARKSEGHSLAEDGVAPFLMIDAAELYYLVEAYLTQQSLDGVEE